MTTKAEALRLWAELCHIDNGANDKRFYDLKEFIDDVPEWQPIESAPRDGTLIFVLASGEIHTAKWIVSPGVMRPDFSGTFTWSGWQVVRLHGLEALSFSPTHWMPKEDLPNPPITGEK